MDNVKTQLSSITSRLSTSAIALLFVAVTITFTVALGLYWYITRSVLNKQVYTYPETKVPKMANMEHVIASTQAPFSKNGKRKSFAFWIYVHDVSQNTAGVRNILRIGGENVRPDALNASPFVFMDEQDTKLYIVFKPDVASVDFKGATSDTARFKELAKQYGIVIPYIPIQRWVHVAVVINETGAGGSITAFVDAEPVAAATDRPVYNLKLDVEGALYIGGESGSGFSGLVSRVMVANYDLNAQDIYNIYKQGPIDNLMARLGLPAYGVRSPLYRV
jgi:hypothetical protein